MTDLNTKRLALSNTLMDLSNEYDILNKQWVDGLSMAQYNKFRAFHTSLGHLEANQVSIVTRSNKLKTIAFKASILMGRMVQVNAELDGVLDILHANLSA